MSQKVKGETMQGRFGKITGLIVLAVVVIFYAQLFAAEFTADLVLNMPGMNDTLKLHVNGHAYRLEKLEGKNKMLLFRIGGKTTALNPEIKEYKVLNMSEESFFNPIAAWENMSYDLTATAEGEETIDGYECRKYKYTNKGSDDIVMERWLSPKLTFIVKQILYSANGEATMELKNIKEEPVDKVMFEIPLGYKPAVDPEEVAIPVPDWAKDLDKAPVMKPPFEKVMKTGDIIKIKTEPGMSVWVRGKSTTDAEAVVKAIPFEDGHPIKLATSYNNFAAKGTICERRQETAAEADYIVVHDEKGEVKVEAKMADMFEKKVAAGGEFRIPISGIQNIDFRLVNLIDGESEVSWEILKNGEVVNPDYAKYRRKSFDKKNKSYSATLSPDGNELVFKVTKGEVLVKAGQYDSFKF
jgi:hypothetical protein